MSALFILEILNPIWFSIPEFSIPEFSIPAFSNYFKFFEIFQTLRTKEQDDIATANMFSNKSHKIQMNPTV